MIEFDENGFATSSGSMTVHRICDNTREWVGQTDEYMSIGTGLARGSYLVGPDGTNTPGFVWCRTDNDTEWHQVEDHRGGIAYDKVSRAALEISELGPIPDTHTLLAPISQFDFWNGHAWERDEAAEQQAILDAALSEQGKRISEASEQIAIIKPAVDGGYAKPEHTQLLSDWQRYRYELTLVQNKAGWPDKPQWSEKPDSIV